jgi:hypothetical protein
MPIDYDAIFGVDDYDPCAALRAMRPAYMRLLAGGAPEKIEFRDRATWFARTDLQEMGALISRLEGDCARSKGRVTNFAITGGSTGGGCGGAFSV